MRPISCPADKSDGISILLKKKKKGKTWYEEWLDGVRVKGILTEQRVEELTLEDVNDSVQGLMQLLVLLREALLGPALVLLSVVKFGPVLLQELQGSLGVWGKRKKKHGGQ